MAEQETKPALIGVKALCQMLELSEFQLLKMRRADQNFPDPVSLPGMHLRWRLVDVERYVAQL